MRPRIHLALALVAMFYAAPAAAAPANKLYIAWSQGTEANCKAEVENFFNCVLGSTNFNQLAAAYPNGRTLTLAKTAVVSCAAKDWQCVVDQGQFPVQSGDVVLEYWGGSCIGGTNYWNVTVTAGGSPVDIHATDIQSGATSCHCQTAVGSHEVYEAAGDSENADCCNGQVNGPNYSPECGTLYCGNCATPFGWYDLDCGGTIYKAQLLGNANNEFSPAGCEQLVQGCSGGGKILHADCAADSECCSGLVCKNWDYDGQPPYTASCCMPVGAACSANTDCCGGSNCTNGSCGCVAQDQWCINAGECCSGFACDLNAHKCIPDPTSSSAQGAGGGGGGGAAATSGGWGEGGAGGGDGSQTEAKGACGCEVPAPRPWSPPALLALSAAAIGLARRRRTDRGRTD